MSDYQPIVRVVELLKNQFDWRHSFIRECCFVSERQLVSIRDESGEETQGDISGPLNLRVVVAAAGNRGFWGIDILFRKVSVFSIGTLADLSFYHRYVPNHEHFVTFSGPENQSECWIASQEVLVRFVGSSYQGPTLLLGHPIPAEVAYKATVVEEAWRRCENCLNIWEVPLDEPRCRCPDCAEITILDGQPIG